MSESVKKSPALISFKTVGLLKYDENVDNKIRGLALIAAE